MNDVTALRPWAANRIGLYKALALELPPVSSWGSTLTLQQLAEEQDLFVMPVAPAWPTLKGLEPDVIADKLMALLETLLQDQCIKSSVQLYQIFYWMMHYGLWRELAEAWNSWSQNSLCTFKGIFDSGWSRRRI